MDDPQPIDIDPAVQDILRHTAPFIDVLQGDVDYGRDLEWSSATSRVETLGELIDVLQELEEEVGPDAELRDWETGTSKHVSAYRFKNGDTEVEL